MRYNGVRPDGIVWGMPIPGCLIPFSMAASVLYRRKHPGRVPSLSVVPPGSSDFTPRPTILSSPDAPVDRHLHSRGSPSAGPFPRFHASPTCASTLRSLGLGHGRGPSGTPRRTAPAVADAPRSRKFDRDGRLPLVPTTNVIVSATDP